MVTAAQLQTIISTAQAAGLDYYAIAEAIDLAMLTVDANGNLTMPWQSMSADGTSITVSVETAMKLANYFRQRGGGVFSQGIEFNRSP